MEARFLDGERFSVDDIISEYLKANNTVHYLLAKDQVRRWLGTLKRRFWTIHHVWFGNINDVGQYGICETEAEYRYSLIRYYSFIKGNIVRAVALKGEAQSKGLLPSGITDKQFLLPSPIDEKKKG